MKRISSLTRKSLTGATILIVAGMVFLETGSRVYQCPHTGQIRAGAWVCDPGYHPLDQEQLQGIQASIEAKRQGADPSRSDLDCMINQVNYADMMGLNGIVCENGMVFVRSNLPVEGRYYVARHELEHLFIRNGVSVACPDEEPCAMWNAARTYPLGFVETVLSSLYLSARESPTVGCFLFGSWTIFREDILGWR